MILDTIAAAARRRVEERKQIKPLALVMEQALACAEGLKNKGVGNGEDKSRTAFEQALSGPGISFICEVKKASPSKGLIAPDFPYVDIAKDYEDAGADAISVLTEPEFFLGNDRYLEEIHQAVWLPLLRKDFTVDPYQIYEARLLGASAVLLICSLLGKEQLTQYLRISRELGLSALVEAHSEEEVSMAADAGAGMIGINNRNLKTFEVDFSNALRLRRLVGPDTIFVAESGIRTAQDIEALAEAEVDAVLIGETLMRAQDRKMALAELKSGCS